MVSYSEITTGERGCANEERHGLSAMPASNTPKPVYYCGSTTRRFLWAFRVPSCISVVNFYS